MRGSNRSDVVHLDFASVLKTVNLLNLRLSRLRSAPRVTTKLNDNNGGWNKYFGITPFMLACCYDVETGDKLKTCDANNDTYIELGLLKCQYQRFMKVYVNALLERTDILDYMALGLKDMYDFWNERSNKNKLSDFVERHWYFDLITSQTSEKLLNIPVMGKRNTIRGG